jgi:hypothetical protein
MSFIPATLTAASGNAGMADAMLLIAVVWFVMPATALAGGIVAFLSLRSGLHWQGVGVAMGLLAIPYALAVLIGGFEGIEILLQAALGAPLEGGIWALPNPVVIGATAVGALWRHAQAGR